VGTLKKILKLILLFSASYSMAADQYLGQWTSAVIRSPQKHRVFGSLELHSRYFSQAGQSYYGFLRPSVGVKVNNYHSLSAGYYWAPSMSGFPSEQRIWEQWHWIIAESAVDFSMYHRIEQRLFSQYDPIGWRYRMFIRMQWGLSDTSSLKLALTNELFINFNRIGTLPEGLDQNRLFLGFFYPWTPDLGLDFGYMLRFQRFTEAIPNRMDHILWLQLRYQLPNDTFGE